MLFPSSAGNVTFLDGSTMGHATAVGNSPNLFIAHDSQSAWVANSLSDTVQRVNLDGGPSGAPIHVARLPGELEFTRDHKTLLVVSLGDASHDGFLTAIDTSTSKPGKPLDVGVGPSSPFLSPDGTTAYLVNEQSNSITVVNLRAWTVSAHIALPCSPTQLVGTPDGTTLFVDCSDASAVLPVTTSSGAVGAPIAVGPGSSIVMGNLGKTIFVNADQLLQEIDVATQKVVLNHDETRQHRQPRADGGRLDARRCGEHGGCAAPAAQRQPGDDDVGVGRGASRRRSPQR